MALKAARLPPESLVFQISEADATSYLKQAKQLTQGLATLHCQAAISQFGCSLNPFNALEAPDRAIHPRSMVPSSRTSTRWKTRRSSRA